MGGTCSSPHLQHQMLKLNSNQDVLWDAANYLKGPKNVKVNNNCRGKMDWSKVFKSIHWICMCSLILVLPIFQAFVANALTCHRNPKQIIANCSEFLMAWECLRHVRHQQSASFVLSFLSSTSALPESSTRMIFPGKSLPCPGQSTKSMGSICFSKNACCEAGSQVSQVSVGQYPCITPAGAPSLQSLYGSPIEFSCCLKSLLIDVCLNANGGLWRLIDACTLCWNTMFIASYRLFTIL